MDDATNGKAIDKVMVIRKGGSTPETVNQTQFLQWLGVARPHRGKHRISLWRDFLQHRPW